MSMWHNDGSNVSTLVKKTLKIDHALEDLNYEILRIDAKFERNSTKSTQRLSEELGASKDTVHHQIMKLVKSYRSCGSLPRELTQQQAQRIVDEKWVYYRNPDASNEWLGPVNLPNSLLKISIVTK